MLFDLTGDMPALGVILGPIKTLEETFIKLNASNVGIFNKNYLLSEEYKLVDIPSLKVNTDVSSNMNIKFDVNSIKNLLSSPGCITASKIS